MKVTKLSGTIAVAALAASAIGLAGCSASDGDGTIELTIWDTNLLAKTQTDGSPDTANSFLHQAAELYAEDHPDVTFDITGQGPNMSENQAQFQAASIAGNGPDIRVQNNGGPLLSFSDFFVDLRDVLDESVFEDISGWETVRADYAEDGPVLGLPYGAGSYFVVWYNKQLLRDAGLDPDDVPATWEDMIARGEDYRDATGDPAFYIANLEGYIGAWTMPTLAAGALGGSAFTDQYSGITRIDSPEMAAAYGQWRDLFASGITNEDAGELSEVDLLSGFISGKAPYFFSGTWFNTTLYEAFGDDVGYFFVPTPAGSEYENVAAGGPNIAIGITNYGKHQEAAADFVRFLARPEIQDLYVELTQIEASSSRSADPSVITNPLLKQQAEDLQQMDAVVFPFDSVMPQAVIDSFYRANTTVFLGTQTPEDAVAQLQTAFDQEQ
jgi:ABC-type glycerol-3-phosphate transport system substrate-binding protein